MRLIHLHVENFGRLSDFDMDFKEGANTVLQENGWGKSTLAAFLRVMFYGLDGERKRDLTENERTRYTPWRKGAFGGTVEFECHGKRYIVTRNLDSKDKDGAFRLQDAVTLLDSKDFTEKLGEEIFGIDRESFGRTSYIDHDAIHYGGINSMIGSKVGSVSQTDDLDRYDAAALLMKNYLNANSPKVKKGALYQQNEEIKQLEQEVAKQDSAEVRIEGCKKLRDQERERLRAVREAREHLQKESEKIAQARAKALQLKRLQEYEKAMAERKMAVQSRRESFGDRLPEPEELQALGEKAEEAKRQEVRLASFAQSTESDRFERLKRYFRNGVPQQEEITRQIAYCNQVQNLMQSRSGLEGQERQERQRLEEGELELKRLEAASALEQAEKRKTKQKETALAAVLICAGILLAIACVWLHWNPLAWLAVLACLLAGAWFPFRRMLHAGAREGSTPISDEQRLRQQGEAGRERVEQLRRELREQESEMQDLEAQIRSFLEAREISYSRSDAESLLYEMKNRAMEYLDLKREKEETDAKRTQLAEEAERAAEELEKALRAMALSETRSDYAAIKEWIAQTGQKLAAFAAEKEEEKKALEACEAFRKEHPELADQSDVLSEEEASQREEELKDRARGLSEEEAQVHELISKYERQLEDEYAVLEDISEKRERLEALREKQEEEEARYKIVLKTQGYLQQAKEQFTARFMQPIKTAFDRYYQIMTNGEGCGDEFQIDANMRISRKEEGAYRDIATQSDGYADMIGLCIRMALLDVMYDSEAPLVIMDDPFSDLDEKHLAGAKRFLAEASKKYQILYLTCHPMREVTT